MKKIDIPVEKVLAAWIMNPLICFRSKEFVFHANKIVMFFFIHFLVVPVFSQGEKTEDQIMQAYELRINGKAGEAKTKLEKILQQDPANPVAYYEMSRLMGSMDIMNVDTSIYYLNKAAELDPDNSLYAFSIANQILLKAYIAGHEENNESQVKQIIGEACDAFQHVLDIKPDCKESMMYLIDVYGSLPEEMGGDKDRAKYWVQELESIDKFYGARGMFILLQEDSSETGYWKNYIADNGESNEALELLGRAYLMTGDIGNAENCFNKIIESDPSRQILLLHLARGHIMRMWQRKASEEEAMPLAKEYILKYLSGDQEKPVCVEAWCYGTLSRLEKGLGNSEKSDEYLEKAKSLKPDFSRAFAIPYIETPPDDTSYSFSSYFRPF
jgi:tetratricopeptide (TPR) repeat protein